MKRKSLLQAMKRVLSTVLVCSMVLGGMQGLGQVAKADVQGVTGTVFTNYITRSGYKLMDGSKELKFVSLNYPQATSDTPWEQENAIKTIQTMGGNVTRSYTIPVTNGNNSGTAYVTGVDSNGNLTYNEDALNALDNLLAVCNKYGVRLIIPLVDHWHWVGGMDGYVWLAYGKDTAHRPSSSSFQNWAWEFYSNEKCIGYFKQMITHLMNRVNTVSGVKYKDDPAVLCWETGNEVGAGPTYQTTYDDVLTQWNKTIVNHIKAQGIKQLVLDGRMSTTAKSRKDNPADILGAHYYEGNYTTRCADDTQTAHAAGYPFILGEFGGKIKASDCTPVFQAGVNNGTNGIMMWSLRAHKDGFGYYFHDEDGYWAAYHWPGFPTGDYYGETEIIRSIYAYAQIANGVAANYDAAKKIAIPAPETEEAPLLYDITTVGDIKWRGVVGGAWYEIQRADGVVTDQNSSAWKTVAGKDEYIYDSGRNWEDKSRDCLRGYHDETALTGQTYSYRLRACNESGVGLWSNIVTVQNAQHVIKDDLDMIAVSSTDRNPTELRNVYSYDHSANVTLSGSAIVNASDSTGYIGYKAIIPIESIEVTALTTVSAGNEPKIYVSPDDNVYLPVAAVQNGVVFTVADVQAQAGNAYYVRVYLPGKSACKIDAIQIVYNNNGEYLTGGADIKSNVMIQDDTFGEAGAEPMYIVKSSNLAMTEGGLAPTDGKKATLIYKTGDDINAYRVISYNQNGAAPEVEVSFDGIEFTKAAVLSSDADGRVVYGNLSVKDSTRVVRITYPEGGNVKIASVEISSGTRSIPLADASPANTLEDGEYYFGTDAKLQSAYVITPSGKSVSYEKQLSTVDYSSYDSMYAWVAKNGSSDTLQFVLKDAAGKKMSSPAYALSGSGASLVKLTFDQFTKESGFDLSQITAFAAVVTSTKNIPTVALSLSSQCYTGNYGVTLQYGTAAVTFDSVYVSSSSKVDDFEGYSGSDNLLNSAYNKNSNGGTFNLALDAVHKSEGSYGLKIEYNYDGKGYAGATKTMDLLNLGGYDGFMLYCESDGSGNQIKIQVETNVSTFSYTGYLTAVGPMIMYMPFKDVKEESWAGTGHVLDQNSNLKSVSIYTNQDSSVTSGTLYFDDIKGANYVTELERDTAVTMDLNGGETVTEFPYAISGTAVYAQYVCVTIGGKSFNVPVKDGRWTYALTADTGLLNGTDIPVKAGVYYPNGTVIAETGEVKIDIAVENNAPEEEPDYTAVWSWDFGTDGTEGWVFDGFSPWLEKGSLISWSQSKYDATFRYTVTGLENGIYTLGNEIKVKSNISYAYMELQNTEGKMVKSATIDTADAFMPDVFLGDTIEVKDGTLTIIYEVGAPDDPNGATFGVKNLTLYKAGDLPGTPDTPEVPTNYLVNGDMESAAADWPNLPTDWNAQYTGGDGWSPIKGEKGTFVLYAGAASTFTLSQKAELLSGKYELSAEIKLLNADTANSVVLSVTAGDKELAVLDAATSLVAEKYVTVKLPVFDAEGTVTVQIAGDFKAKGLALDNVTLYRIGDADPVEEPEPEAPTNYLVNGDMESAAADWPNLPTDWTAAYTGGDGWEPIKGENGTFVLYAGAASTFTLSQKAELLSGKYELSAEIKLLNADTANSVVLSVTAGDKELAVLDAATSLVAEKYVTVKLPAFDAEGTVTVQIAGDFKAKGLALDNVTLYRIGDADPVEEPEPEPEPVKTADLKVVIDCEVEGPTVAVGTYGVATKAEPVAITVTEGEEITLTAGEYEGVTFAYWKEKGASESYVSKTLTVTAVGKSEYTAVYSVNQKVTVEFKGLSAIQTFQYEADVAPAEIIVPSPIAYDGYENGGWKIGTTVYETADALQIALASLIAARPETPIVVEVVYNVKAVTYQVKINGGTGSGSYEGHAVAVAAAKEENSAGEKFAYWEGADGTIVSYRPEYSFFVDMDIELTAVYAAEVKPAGITMIESVTPDTVNHKLKIVSVSSVPNDCTMIKAGLIATNDESIGRSGDRFNDKTAQYVKSGTPNSHSAKYTWTKSSVTEDQTWYVRGYLVYKDSTGAIQTVYGDVVAAKINQAPVTIK